MKQIAQRPRDGRISVVDAPLPALRPGWLLVANSVSLISAGTERTKMELGAKNLAQKARARPDLLKKMVERARSDGIASALAVARDRLDALTPLGYSSAGSVLRLGTGLEGFAVGDRVACGGGGFATHAEVIAVPRNLVAAVPDGVPLESAAYATVGAVALHGIRRAEAQLGEHVGVIGLGLVGQLAVRILAAGGCRVVGVDLDRDAVTLAAAAGALAFQRDRDGLEGAVLEATDGLGLDSVLVCAAATSADPVRLASELARERGRVVIVGDVPIEADRALFYEKELELRLSRSYGPGRYDRDYEERGRDLPPAYVRWTEQRNMQAFLDLVASGAVDPSPLTTHRFPVEQAERAYALLTYDRGEERPFGILLEYAYEERPAAQGPHSVRPRAPGTARIGLIGAGAFARATLLPALRDAGAEFAAVASGGGLTATDVATRFGFERAADSADEIFADDSITAVVIATHHAGHAPLTASALRAGKAVLVEKPLTIDRDGLAEVEEALSTDSLLMVGFNRRFAPLAVQLRRELEAIASPTLLARVNAGPLPPDHWTHDPEDGGGRLIGEGCHFVDLLSYLAGARAATVHALAVPHPQRPLECSDEVVATLRFTNGAVGTFLYSGGGDPRLPKERIEAFGGGLAAVLDDFRRLELYRSGKRDVTKQRTDKGHKKEVARFLAAVRGDEDAPAVDTYLDSTRATLALLESLRDGSAVEVAVTQVPRPPYP
jgi:predicted dehydrogenase/threonine dehydrogenase-like Zn-dependent dehydrogenase